MRSIFVALALLAGPAAALELSLPSAARLQAERNTGPDRYSVPVGVFEKGALPAQVIEGDVARAAWRLNAPGLTPLQIARPLREQLEAAGYRIVLDCMADGCGGFDFRFGVEVLPGPNMYVNIGAFQFLSALKGPADQPSAAITILASTTANSAYIQIIQAGTETASAAPTGDVPASTAPLVQGDLVAALLGHGHAVLDGLEFDTAAANLGEAPVASLGLLAELLKSRPNLRVGLVGHTDSVGGLAGNITLSKQRAQAVRQRLIDAHGIDAGRLEAEGMGYLSPRASNLSAAGREDNRRVEVILLSE
ncbi:MAG: OmpA family protein [Sulfitobacter sp.]